MGEVYIMLEGREGTLHTSDINHQKVLIGQ